MEDQPGAGRWGRAGQAELEQQPRGTRRQRVVMFQGDIAPALGDKL